MLKQQFCQYCTVAVSYCLNFTITEGNELMDITVVDIFLWTRIALASIRNPVENNGGSNSMYTGFVCSVSCHGFFLPNQGCPGRKQICGQILPVQWHDQQNDCQHHQRCYTSFWAPGRIHTCEAAPPAKKTKIITAYIESIASVQSSFYHNNY